MKGQTDGCAKRKPEECATRHVGVCVVHHRRLRLHRRLRRQWLRGMCYDNSQTRSMTFEQRTQDPREVLQSSTLVIPTIQLEWRHMNLMKSSGLRPRDWNLVPAAVYTHCALEVSQLPGRTPTVMRGHSVHVTRKIS